MLTSARGAKLAPSRGVESPVPTGVHTLAWTAAEECDEKLGRFKITTRGEGPLVDDRSERFIPTKGSDPLIITLS